MKHTARTLHINCQNFIWSGFRIGLVFVVSDEDDIDGMQDAGVALVRAYNYISDEVDSQSAFEALISVSPSFTNTHEEIVLLKTAFLSTW